MKNPTVEFLDNLTAIVLKSVQGYELTDEENTILKEAHEIAEGIRKVKI